jgi:rhodanese-related sulfurtransferase
MTTDKSVLREIAPRELAVMLNNNEVVLVDVREPDEFASARIHGALLAPLSSFDPAFMPRNPGQPIVLQCGSGKRSAVAAAKCMKAGVPIAGHLSGGLVAWRQVELPTITLDPSSGKIVERR